MSEHEFSSDFSAPFNGLFSYPLFTTGARLHFGFPFWLGAENPLVSVITVPTRWATVGGATEPWRALGANAHRFERIYAKPQNTFGEGINFSFKIASQFPFKLTTDSQVVLTSAITNP